MGRLTGILRGLAASTALLAAALILQSASPAWAAADRLSGYTPAVRDRAQRVVAAASPGNVAALEKEVRALRKAMYAQGVLSINAIPDLIFERAAREGWSDKATASLRTVTAVSALSAPTWAMLVKEDLLEARFDALGRDFEGLAGAMREFAPARLGYVAWLASYLSAAAFWFVAWGSVALFMRARPSLEADVSRIVVIPPRDAVAAGVATLAFLLPLAGGLGLAVAACFWVVVSAGYLRRGEIAMMAAIVALLACLLAAGGVVQSVNRVGSDVRRGGWLRGEGYLPPEWPDESPAARRTLGGPSSSAMIKFARARAAMMSGDAPAAERLWTELERGGEDTPEVYNNRGIALAVQGRTADALSDFEAALAKRPNDGPALWNAYQIYLQTFNLERARAVQPQAWDSLRRMSPYNFRPADMEQGEWVASALPVDDLRDAFFGAAGAAVADAGGSDFFRMFYRPLKPSGAVVFLVMALLAAMIWKILSLRIWVHTTCRGCGTRSQVAGARDALNLCNQCRSQIGSGHKAGGERDRRAQWIGLHRRYVRVCSVLVPGSGGLWAGNTIRAALLGVVLALSLGGVSASAGRGDGGAIVSELRGAVMIWAAAVSAAVWVAGAAWGIRAFDRFQSRYNVGPGRS